MHTADQQKTDKHGPAWHGLKFAARGPSADQLRQIELLLRAAGAKIRR